MPHPTFIDELQKKELENTQNTHGLYTRKVLEQNLKPIIQGVNKQDQGIT